MEEERVFALKFSKVYPYLIQKAERKNRSKEEVFEVTSWLTGYSAQDLEKMLESDISYGDFMQNAPAFHPNSTLIKGSVCGVKVEDIEDPLMRRIRYLDKLVDELAKGKSMDKILRG